MKGLVSTFDIPPQAYPFLLHLAVAPFAIDDLQICVSPLLAPSDSMKPDIHLA